MELKDIAKEMYKNHSAPTIAKELGVSEATVRRWVKGMKKVNMKEYDSVVEQIYTLSIRPQGIRNKEEWSIYSNIYGYEADDETGYKRVNLSDSQKSYIRSLVRAKASKVGLQAMFVPDWISHSAPRASWEGMLTMTNELYERMQEHINEFMYEHNMPKDSRYAVEQQLRVMLIPEYSPRSIQDICYQATEVVDILERSKEKIDAKSLDENVSGVFESMKEIEQFIY